MAVSLASLRRATAELPPRSLIYGTPGIGKTTFANEYPGAVFVQTEDGTPAGEEINTFGHLTSFADVMQATASLLEEEHEFKTVVYDSLDKLEPLVWAQTCEDNKLSHLEEPGYGKGYTMADNVWREFIALVNQLRTKKGMAVVYLAHSTIERFDDPTTASYSRYDIRLHKRALALFQDDVDAILLLGQDVTIKEEKTGYGGKEKRATGGGNRWVYTEGRPSFVAKNRYGLPEKFLFQKGRGFATMAPFLPGFEDYDARQSSLAMDAA